MTAHRHLSGALPFVVFSLGVFLLAHDAFRNRHRYKEVCMIEFYQWSAELRGGGDPWNLAPSYKPPAGVVHRGDCNYPPVFLRAFEPLTVMSPVAAYWVWQAILILSLLGATAIIVRELEPGAGIHSYAIVLGGVMLLPEVHGSLYESEATLLLLLLLVAAWISDRRDRSWIAGLMLALAALLKIYPGLAGGYFLGRRRWATLGWAIGFAIAGMLLSGVGDQQRFLSAGVFHSVWLTDDNWLRNDRSVATLSNLRALLDWLHGASLPAAALPLWYGLTAAFDILLICPALYLTASSDGAPDLDAPCFGLWLTAAIMISPIAWGHYLPLLIPLLLSITVLMMRRTRFDAVGGFMMAVGLIGAIAPYFSSPIRRWHTFFIATLMIYAGACLLIMSWSREREPSAR
jgi:hypothetical protein